MSDAYVTNEIQATITIEQEVRNKRRPVLLIDQLGRVWVPAAKDQKLPLEVEAQLPLRRFVEDEENE